MAEKKPEPEAQPEAVAPDAPVDTTPEPTKSYVIIADDAKTENLDRKSSAGKPATAPPKLVEPVEVETPTANPATVAPVVEPEPNPYVTKVSDSGQVEPVAVAPAPQIIYVTAPTPPKTEGNRAAGIAIAALASAVFAAALAAIVIAFATAVSGSSSVAILAQFAFFVPVIAFVIGFVLLVLVVNRGGWWAYIIGSAFVAAFVYFGSTAVIVLGANIAEGNFLVPLSEYTRGLASPVQIIAALLAREVALWAGALISRFGKRVKARNIEARETFDREQAEARAANA